MRVLTFYLPSSFLANKCDYVSNGLQYLVKNEATAWGITRFIIFFYSTWSLDVAKVAPHICFNHTFSGIQAVALEYLPAFYSLTLVFATYTLVELHDRDFRFVVWMWKPFRKCFSRMRRQLNPTASLINAFATFLHLSYSRFLVTSLLLVTPMKLWNKTGHHVSTVLLYDGSVEYLKSIDHKCLFTLAISVLIVFITLPPIFLLLYPTRKFHIVLKAMKCNVVGLTAFTDCFQGCYKDGSNGNRDYRWFSFAPFLIRILVFAPYTLVWWSHTDEVDPFVELLLCSLFIFYVPLFLYFNPYKDSNITKVDITMNLYFAFLVIVNSYNAKQEELDDVGISERLMLITLSIPAIIAILYVLKHIVKRKYSVLGKCFSKYPFLHFLLPRIVDEGDETESTFLIQSY